MENKITASMIQAMRPEINKALEEIGKKYGVTLNAGNATYSDLEATFKLKVTLVATTDFNPDKVVWEQLIP